MQLKHIPGVIATVFIVISAFSAFVVARPSFGRIGSAIHSYHTRSQHLFHGSSAPSFPDFFWNVVTSNSGKAKAYAEKLIQDAQRKYKDIVTNFDELKSGMDALVAESHDFNTQVEASNISMDDLGNELSKAIDQIVEGIQDEFKEPLPEDQDERYKHRQKIIVLVLDRLGVAFVDACVALGLEEDVGKSNFERLRPKFHHVLSITGNIIDKHPELVETVLWTVVCLLLPAAWLRFPLRLFGFGPLGPVKGSFAAWLQRCFWGGAVAEGSWFALLQRAGMKGVTWVWRFFAALFGAIAIVRPSRGC